MPMLPQPALGPQMALFGSLPLPMPMLGAPPPPPPPTFAEPPIPMPQRGVRCEMLAVAMIEHLFEVGQKLMLAEFEICELIQLAVFKMRNSAGLRSKQYPASLAHVISEVHPSPLSQMDEKMGLHYLAILMNEKTKSGAEQVFNRVGLDKRGSGSFDRFYRTIFCEEPYNVTFPFVWRIVPARL